MSEKEIKFWKALYDLKHKINTKPYNESMLELLEREFENEKD